MLIDKIKKLIGLIENTEIEEIEVSSFWGAQKIRLSKSKAQSESVIVNKATELNVAVDDSKSEVKVDLGSKNVDLEDLSAEESSPEEDYSDDSKFKIIILKPK